MRAFAQLADKGGEADVDEEEGGGMEGDTFDDGGTREDTALDHEDGREGLDMEDEDLFDDDDNDAFEDDDEQATPLSSLHLPRLRAPPRAPTLPPLPPLPSLPCFAPLPRESPD